MTAEPTCNFFNAVSLPFETEIRQETGVSDIINAIRMAKHRWAGHITRLPENRWTIGAQEIGPENRAFQKHAGGMDSPNSLDLHGRDWLRTDTYGIIPGKGSSIRSELSPDNDDDDNDLASQLTQGTEYCQIKHEHFNNSNASKKPSNPGASCSPKIEAT